MKNTLKKIIARLFKLKHATRAYTPAGARERETIRAVFPEAIFYTIF